MADDGHALEIPREDIIQYANAQENQRDEPDRIPNTIGTTVEAALGPFKEARRLFGEQNREYDLTVHADEDIPLVRQILGIPEPPNEERHTWYGKWAKCLLAIIAPYTLTTITWAYKTIQAWKHGTGVQWILYIVFIIVGALCVGGTCYSLEPPSYQGNEAAVACVSDVSTFAFTSVTFFVLSFVYRSTEPPVTPVTAGNKVGNVGLYQEYEICPGYNCPMIGISYLVPPAYPNFGKELVEVHNFTQVDPQTCDNLKCWLDPVMAKAQAMAGGGL